MLNLKLFSQVSSQKGMATIEVVPILVVFVLIINFTMGFFGVIHSGILASIAARNYAFETFRNRANLRYLRDNVGGADDFTYTKMGYRFHGIVEESSGADSQWYVTRRPIKFSEVNTGVDRIGSDSDHNKQVRTVADDKKASEVFSGVTKDDGNAGINPVWVRTIYGICLNSKCGGGT